MTTKTNFFIPILREIVYILRIIYLVIIRPLDGIITELHLRIFTFNKKPEKKILGCWDYNNTGGKLGDFIVFLQVLNVLRLKFNLGKNKKNIDLCLIDDNTHHNSKLVLISKSYFWKKMMISLIVLNPYIDSVYYFNSNAEFNQFYIQNKKRYFRWPFSMFPKYVPARMDVINDFAMKNNYLPSLSIPKEVLSKIYDFYRKKVFPSLPVVLNIRRNPTRFSERNSNIKELKKFLKGYENDPTYKFIIICNKEEIPHELKKLKNVLCSKDYFNDIMCDLALIKASYLSIFPSSGMSTLAKFSDVPFIQFGEHMRNIYSPFEPKTYLKKYQRFFDRIEDSEWLKSEFENLIQYLKKHKINNYKKNKVKGKMIKTLF